MAKPQSPELPVQGKRSLVEAVKSHLPKVVIAFLAMAAAGGGLFWYVHRPMTADRYYWSGRKNLEKGETALAMRNWRLAVNLDKTYSPAYLAMAQVEQESGNLGKSADLLGTVLYYHPKYPHIQCRRAQLYGMANRFEMAYTVAQDAVSIEPTCPAAHNALGMLLEMADDIGGAARELGQAHAFSPADDALTLDYARVLAKSGKHDEALAIVEAELPKTKFRIQANYLEGWLLSEYGRGGRIDYGTALHHLGLALVDNPDHTASLTQLGIVYLHLGNLHGAQDTLEHAFKKGPDTIELLDALVTLYSKINSPLLDQARETNQKIRKMILPLKAYRHTYVLHPDDLTNVVALAHAELDLGNVLDAFQLISTAHAKAPQRKDVSDLYNQMKHPDTTAAIRNPAGP